MASIAAGSLVFADGSDTSASALGLTDTQVTQIAAQVSATAEADREAYLAKIAANLGVDVAKLKEAIAKANLDTLDEKVADGSITQERAEAMRASPFPFAVRVLPPPRLAPSTAGARPWSIPALAGMGIVPSHRCWRLRPFRTTGWRSVPKSIQRESSPWGVRSAAALHASCRAIAQSARSC